jgi:hypothetical protein
MKQWGIDLFASNSFIWKLDLTGCFNFFVTAKRQTIVTYAKYSYLLTCMLSSIKIIKGPKQNLNMGHVISLEMNNYFF